MSTNLVDLYLAEGCGRCARYQTSECSTQFWKEELKLLRKLALGAGLREELKWKHPCYTLEGKNIVLLGAFRERCAMTFFKGSIMSDPAQVLEFQGENSRVAKTFYVTSLDRLKQFESTLATYIQEAIELEKSGAVVPKSESGDQPIPEELAAKFDELPEFREAFYRLTPGRQRGYLIHFSQPKQSKTREARIEKSIDDIMVGKGFHD